MLNFWLKQIYVHSLKKKNQRGSKFPFYKSTCMWQIKALALTSLNLYDNNQIIQNIPSRSSKIYSGTEFNRYEILNPCYRLNIPGSNCRF